MKATDLLKQQHREVETLFSRIESSEGAEKAELVRELAANLAAHMRIEEELVYPKLQQIDEDLGMEALEEHTLVAFEMRRLADAGLEAESADAKLKTMKELVEHHVEEEEAEMFPKLERALGSEGSVELLGELEARFDAIRATGYGSDLFGKKNGRAKRRAPESRAMRQ